MRGIRISIFLVTAILIAIGAIMVYSSSAIYAYENMGDSLLFFKRHIFFILMGAINFILFLAFDYRRLKAFSRPMLFCGITLLILVLVPSLGSQAGGARRWLRVWNFSFQPSEFTKMALIIYLADFLSRKSPRINDISRALLPLLAITGAVTGLLLLQPDLGTAVLVALFALILLFYAGLRWSYIIAAFTLSIPAFFLLIYRVPYRLNRIKVFLNPWQDPRGTGFQIIQSFLAFGSGGLFGVGLGMSRQKLLYLPQAHTDFIFSIIGEELGLIGSLSVVFLFMILIWQGMRVVFKAEDSFGRYLSLGIISMIALEVLINIGVTIGALPTKGLPLPFISYGGTALVFHMIAVALLLNVAKNAERAL